MDSRRTHLRLASTSHVKKCRQWTLIIKPKKTVLLDPRRFLAAHKSYTSWCKIHPLTPMTPKKILFRTKSQVRLWFGNRTLQTSCNHTIIREELTRTCKPHTSVSAENKTASAPYNPKSNHRGNLRPLNSNNVHQHLALTKSGPKFRSPSCGEKDLKSKTWCALRSLKLTLLGLRSTLTQELRSLPIICMRPKTKIHSALSPRLRIHLKRSVAVKVAICLLEEERCR